MFLDEGKPIPRDVFERFTFLKYLIGEKNFEDYGANAIQGLGGNGLVVIAFGPPDSYIGRPFSVELDETGEIRACSVAGRQLHPSDPSFPKTRPTEQEAKDFIRTLFTRYELRGVLANRVPKKYRFDVASESGSRLPDLKITHHDLWDLAANQGRSIEEIAHTVETQLQREGLLAKK